MDALKYIYVMNWLLPGVLEHVTSRGGRQIVPPTKSIKGTRQRITARDGPYKSSERWNFPNKPSPTTGGAATAARDSSFQLRRRNRQRRWAAGHTLADAPLIPTAFSLYCARALLEIFKPELQPLCN